MDLFRDRADAILEVAQMGVSGSVTVLLHDNGPGRASGIHLIMGESAESRLGPQSAGTSAYRVTRTRDEVTVRGSQGGRSCEVRGQILVPVSPALLLNNQALYQVQTAQCLLPVQ